MDEIKVETTENVEATETVNETNKAPEVDVEAIRAELNRLMEENDKLRKATTNASADASEWKKKFRATQSEAERAEAERQETIEKMKAENEELKRNQTLAEYKNEFLGIGFDGDTAGIVAQAFWDKDFGGLVTAVKEWLTAHDKALTADIFKRTPAPTGGSSASGEITAEQFNAMGYMERVQLFNDNPELYKALTGK